MDKHPRLIHRRRQTQDPLLTELFSRAEFTNKHQGSRTAATIRSRKCGAYASSLLMPQQCVLADRRRTRRHYSEQNLRVVETGIGIYASSNTQPLRRGRKTSTVGIAGVSNWRDSTMSNSRLIKSIFLTTRVLIFPGR
jgi:hypothetical protein